MPSGAPGHRLYSGVTGIIEHLAFESPCALRRRGAVHLCRRRARPVSARLTTCAISFQRSDPCLGAGTYGPRVSRQRLSSAGREVGLRTRPDELRTSPLRSGPAGWLVDTGTASMVRRAEQSDHSNCRWDSSSTRRTRTRLTAAVVGVFLVTIFFGHLLADPFDRGASVHAYAMANFFAAVAILWLQPRGDRFSMDALLSVPRSRGKTASSVPPFLA